MSEAQYTVFCDEEGSDWQGLFGSPTSGTHSLESLIVYAAEFRGYHRERYAPVAWVEYDPSHCGIGHEGCRALRAESIAAGRLIELVDGKYVARGMTPTLDKLEAESELPELVKHFIKREMGARDAAMIARDGPQQDSFCVCRNHTAPGVVHRSDGPCYMEEPQSTAKPALAALTRVAAQGHQLGLGKAF
jgi:hypothetical protein